MPKVIVYHSYYGCETGCCGHIIEVDDEEKNDTFEFTHPYGEDRLKWAQDFVREKLGEQHVADLDWENSLVSED